MQEGNPHIDILRRKTNLHGVSLFFVDLLLQQLLLDVLGLPPGLEVALRAGLAHVVGVLGVRAEHDLGHAVRALEVEAPHFDGQVLEAHGLLLLGVELLALVHVLAARLALHAHREHDAHGDLAVLVAELALGQQRRIEVRGDVPARQQRAHTVSNRKLNHCELSALQTYLLSTLRSPMARSHAVHEG
jgi:hypothetical protein